MVPEVGYVPTRCSTNNLRLNGAVRLQSYFAEEAGSSDMRQEDVLSFDEGSDDDENELYLQRFAAGIGARDPSKSSSTSTASLKRLVLLEPVDVAGEVSLLLVLPFRKRGETSVRVTVVEVSEAEDNTDVDMWVR